MSILAVDAVESLQSGLYSNMPGIRSIGLNIYAENNNLTIANNTMTPTNTPFAGYLIKTLTRLNLDRITFPKIYKPANTKCQVDICGYSLVLLAESTSSLTAVGTAISGGEVAGNEATKAFDGNTSTYYISTQSGAGVNGVAYIGRDFGVKAQVTSAVWTSYQSAYAVTSLKSQYSDDGTNWTDIGTHAVTATDFTNTSITVPAYPAARYFRLLANSATTYNFVVREISLTGYAQGALQAVSATSVTLPASASSVDGYYVGDTIVIISGTGAGQTRKIVAYNGTTKVATLDQPWTTLPTTSSGFALYDGIASDIQPGFDFSTIDYTVYPTVNVLCSLERLTGATASPSMGVPIVTSIKYNAVQRGTGTATLVGSQIVVNVTLSEPVSVNGSRAKAWVKSTSATAYTADIVPVLTTETNLQLKISGSNATAPVEYSWEVEAI